MKTFQVKLTEAELSAIRHALYLAGQWELTVIDAYCVEYAKGPQGYRKPKVVPQEYKPEERACKKNIKAFDKLKAKLKLLNTPSQPT